MECGFAEDLTELCSKRNKVMLRCVEIIHASNPAICAGCGSTASLDEMVSVSISWKRKLFNILLVQMKEDDIPLWMHHYL